MDKKIFKEAIVLSNLTEEELKMIQTWKTKICGGYGQIKKRMIEIIKSDLKSI